MRRQGLRSADEAETELEASARSVNKLFELADLRDAEPGAPALKAAARLARMIAEYPIADRAEVPGPLRSLELQAAAECGALLEVAELEPQGADRARSRR